MIVLIGCGVDDETGELQLEIQNTTALASDFAITAADPPGTPIKIPGLRHTWDLAAGEAVYINALGTTTSNQTGNMLDEMIVQCSNGHNQRATQNHMGSDSKPAEKWQAVRMLFIAPTAGRYDCGLEARVWHPPGVHTYKATAAKTKLSTSTQVSGWAWGTENDTRYDEHDDVYVGPGMSAGTSEYALRGARFEVPASVSSFDVYSEIELTNCYNAQPDTGCEVGGGSLHVGSTVDLQLLVQQMQSPTSSTVCQTTTYPSTGYLRFTVTYDEHHKKAHMMVANVGFNPNCTGRSFIVKSYVGWVSGNVIHIEGGTHGSAGYSSSFAFHAN